MSGLTWLHVRLVVAPRQACRGSMSGLTWLHVRLDVAPCQACRGSTSGLSSSLLHVRPHAPPSRIQPPSCPHPFPPSFNLPNHFPLLFLLQTPATVASRP
eukprot:1955339-Rhodomonas_salina.1